MLGSFLYGTLFFLAHYSGRFFNEVADIFVSFLFTFFWFELMVIWKGGSVVLRR